MQKPEGLFDALDAKRIEWKKHALTRMLERGISRAEVLQTLQEGVIIESYPEDYPFPSHLVCKVTDHPLHVVFAWNDSEQICYLITAYRPDREHFESDFITRRPS
ncbi:DUF4258 domain-containing protein [Marinospirillum sp.]|uniref:DUF4258 domain-containing protein n=1 Tax=Marinospirillum sp. TaxID=2183934 RepID=UPI00384EFBFF